MSVVLRTVLRRQLQNPALLGIVRKANVAEHGIPMCRYASTKPAELEIADATSISNDSTSASEKKEGKAEVYREISDSQGFPHFKQQQEAARKAGRGTEEEWYDKKIFLEEDYPEPSKLIPKNEPGIGEISMPHPIYTMEEMESVKIAHKKPKDVTDWLAYCSVYAMRLAFDLTSGYTFGTLNENNWLRRIIFLETVAGVPGMMGAMVRHLKSLRTMKRDHGWIHTLLEEAENERMHLMIAMHIYQPSKLFRMGAVTTQGIFVNFFFLAYMISPRFCHRFVGYLEEEAVKTYTKLLADIRAGKIPEWIDKPAMETAVKYWKLPEGATYYDMFSAIRADEAHHRLVNHTLSSMKQIQHNPFRPGK